MERERNMAVSCNAIGKDREFSSQGASKTCPHVEFKGCIDNPQPDQAGAQDDES